MIKIILYTQNSKGITGFDIAGHAGYDEIGKDIVCAAVSVLSQVAAEYVRDKMPSKYIVRDDNGLTVLNISDLSEEEQVITNVVMGMFELGISSVADQYPDHVRVEIANGQPT